MAFDGGGTKTAVLLCDASGRKVSTMTKESLDYTQIGFEEIERRLHSWTDEILRDSGLGRDAITAITVGMPMFSEQPDADQQILSSVHQAFGDDIEKYVINDVACAMWGALAGQAGICILCGTGSMAMGMDATGTICRAGGWSSLFSDIGSGYWFGKEAMSLFAKECDEVVARGALMDILCSALNISAPFDAIAIFDDLFHKRRETAALQQYMFQAARAGDVEALKTYRYAAEELSLLAVAVQKRLFSGQQNVIVSYAGGMFYTKSLLLEPLKIKLAEQGMQLFPPKLSPVEGAMLYTAVHAHRGDRGAEVSKRSFISNMRNQRR